MVFSLFSAADKRKMVMVIAPVLFILTISCGQREKTDTGVTVIVFKHGKIPGDPVLFRELLSRFENEHPFIKVKDEALPASTDEQHQFYVINLEGKSRDFDVLSMDVIWVPEFARAGWLRDLSDLLPENEREEFFPGPMRAVTYGGKIYAIPWYVDAGVLYYRKDLLKKYGFSPPRTWQELVDIAAHVTSKEEGLYGFVWQGKQYEGLVCNALEYFWANNGEMLKDGRVVVNSPENVYALGFMRDLMVKYRVTPPLVTTAIEEPTRHIFGSGRAVFMRNWPYAWNIFEKADSPVKGKTGMSMLPSFPGKEPATVLGGWQLGINRYSKHPDAAEKLVRFLTSAETLKSLALTIGYKPARRSLYRDRDFLREQPSIAELYDIFMKARPRPVSPYYMMMSEVLQPELSGAISGIKKPEEALESARKQIEHLLEAGP